MVPACVMVLLSIRAMPKSAIFAWPALVSMMFAGLMSRCTTPRSWLYCSPASRSSMIRTVVGQREPLLLVEQRFQRRTVHEFHDDVGDIAGLAVVEDADDVGMGQPAGGLRLTAEAGQLLLGFRIVGISGSRTVLMATRRAMIGSQPS